MGLGLKDPNNGVLGPKFQEPVELWYLGPQTPLVVTTPIMLSAVADSQWFIAWIWSILLAMLHKSHPPSGHHNFKMKARL